MKRLRLTALLGAGALTAALLSAPSVASADPGVHVCTGTVATPGFFSGNFNDVVVNGVCGVNGGPTLVRGDLTVTPGGAVVAAWASSPLTVRGSVRVASGGSAILGCFARSFPCLDDPNPNPTLNGPVKIDGDLQARQPLGVVTHDMTVGGDVSVIGGGGGVNCTPSGIFAKFQSPVYTDNEDGTVRGNFRIIGVQTCWLGTLRINVKGDLTDIGNKMADPDAGEVVSNVVGGDISCFGNSPAVQFGDSGGIPNQVKGDASGQCGFRTLQPNPAPDGPLTPISVRAGH